MKQAFKSGIKDPKRSLPLIACAEQWQHWQAIHTVVPWLRRQVSSRQTSGYVCEHGTFVSSSHSLFSEFLSTPIKSIIIALLNVVNYLKCGRCYSSEFHLWMSFLVEDQSQFHRGARLYRFKGIHLSRFTLVLSYYSQQRLCPMWRLMSVFTAGMVSAPIRQSTVVSYFIITSTAQLRWSAVCLSDVANAIFSV